MLLSRDLLNCSLGIREGTIPTPEDTHSSILSSPLKLREFDYNPKRPNQVRSACVFTTYFPGRWYIVQNSIPLRNFLRRQYWPLFYTFLVTCSFPAGVRGTDYRKQQTDCSKQLKQRSFVIGLGGAGIQMSFVPSIRCSICKESCDTLCKYIAHLNNHQEDDKLKPARYANTIAKAIIQSELLFPAVMKPSKTVRKLDQPLLNCGLKATINRSRNRPFVSSTNDCSISRWTDMKILRAEPENAMESIKTRVFSPSKFRIHLGLPTKYQSKYGRDAHISNWKLMEARCVVKKMNHADLKAYGYELKGNKYVLVKKVEEHSDDSKNRGRPSNTFSKKKSKKSHGQETKKCKPSAPAAIPKAKTLRLCRGEEFTMFLHARPGGWAQIANFCKDGDLPLDSMFNEEKGSDKELFNGSLSDTENTLPFGVDEMMTFLIKNCPIPVIKKDVETATPCSSFLSSIATYASGMELRGDGESRDEKEPTSRGRSPMNERTIVDNRKNRPPSSSKMFKCKLCKSQGTSKIMREHHSTAHPDDPWLWIPVL